MKRAVASALVALAAVCSTATVRAATLPPNFQETAVFTGLIQPTVVKFASDGRIFVAEKRGVIKVFDNLQDTTPTTFADFRTNVHNFWDRGFLGMALHPNFPATPYVYVLYTLDQRPGGPIPSWGTANTDSDGCPNPPGATSQGCTVGGRLSRFEADGSIATGPEQVLLQEWCQQFPSHSIGSLVFGEDGALYVTGGDGASFNVVDYGQLGGSTTPVNVCGDPPGPVGGPMTAPTAEGGALRSQSRRRAAGGPVVLDGTVLRVDPATGAALPDNPLFTSTDPNARRLVADGLRNPFRAAWRPGTSELWVGDVGWGAWEEVNRLSDPTTQPRNFGWPCYEGASRQSGYDGANLNLCENLYGATGAVTSPYFTYSHSANVVSGDGCPTGSSAIAGLAFHPTNGPYPSQYRGALFFTDYNRRCIWAMLPNGSGTPDPSSRQVFASSLAGGAVHLETGPGGDIFYADFDGGRVVRIEYFAANAPPTAVMTANPTNGPAPLSVVFDGSGSSDPEGQALAYAWDLDGDGAFDDGSGVTASFTYLNPGNYSARLRVTDTENASDTDSLVISADNTPPAATILTPSASLTWKVGDTIAFSGQATDPQQGSLPDSALTWTLVMQHCPSNCHEHTVQQWVGVASGSFSAPDHEYPSYLELRLLATDAGGLNDIKSVALNPQTVALTFQTSPAGLQLAVNATQEAAPFARTVIVGSLNSVSAPSPQSLGGTSYAFSSWSDGGAQSHGVTAPASATTYTATYAPVNPQPSVALGDASVTEGNSGTTPAVFTVTLSTASTQTVTVTWSTSTGGTAKAGSDYQAGSGTLTFAPGVTSQSFGVQVVGDVTREKTETFTVRLGTATNATIADGRGQGRIVNDDN